MDHGTVMTIFVIVAAVALLIQAALLAALFIFMRRSLRQASQLARDLEQIAPRIGNAAVEILTVSRDPVKNIMANLSDVSVMVRERARALDEALDGATERTRMQAERVDQMVSEFLNKVENTANALHQSVLPPIQEVSAIFKGVGAGLGFLFARRPSEGAREPGQDDEMFI